MYNPNRPRGDYAALAERANRIMAMLEDAEAQNNVTLLGIGELVMAGLPTDEGSSVDAASWTPNSGDNK